MRTMRWAAANLCEYLCARLGLYELIGGAGNGACPSAFWRTKGEPEGRRYCSRASARGHGCPLEFVASVYVLASRNLPFSLSLSLSI